MVEPSNAVQMWLWIGTIGMALGALVFLVLAARERPGHRWFHTITFFIAAIATVAYLGMSLKQGWFPILREGHEFYEPFYWARYVDWFFTTPLLLLDLALLAGASKEAIVWLIGLDLGMIATGFFAGVTSSDLLEFVHEIAGPVTTVQLLRHNTFPCRPARSRRARHAEHDSAIGKSRECP